MKKVLLLIAVLFGTSVMVSAKPVTEKSATAKEVKMTKHPKHKKNKTEKKSATTGTASSSTKK
ncbi:hypothetical protein C8C85_1219 [Flavobacterium sp. 103]|uniref:hypothetical protein n=1 Tax=Flavobacterium sp. 103 TaxID=2135624 RepID=UPI000D5D4510|nr:hypothetical protein [Flavobacterium sp. 103]PVX45426.1 hypothetical protein C8C85_1219 [Flavobacterium sp. 103]